MWKLSSQKKFHIYLIIIIVVVIYTSVIVLPYNAAGKTLHNLEIESNSVVQNVPSINVGEGPTSIAVDDWEDNKVYVANFLSNSVSVIDGDTLEVSNVNVGEYPDSIAVDDKFDNIAYVANSGPNTVSVIDGDTLKGVSNVSLGEYPISTSDDEIDSVAVNEQDNLAYVANYDSNTVYVIYGPSHKVQAGVLFDVNPFHAGRINCNNFTVSTNQYFYIDFGTECKAIANEGFQFSSWIENLEINSSRIIKASTASDFPLYPLLNTLSGGPKDTSATLNVTKFGSFTANFEELPPPLPPEYWSTLFSVVATALVGTWLIPSVIGWTKSKRQHKTLRQYRKRIASLDNRKSEDNQVERQTAHELKNDITTAYSRGKINELQHEILKEEISQYNQETISKTIDSLKNMSNRNNEQYIQALDKTRKQLKDAYSEGKINNEQYTDLKNEISVLYEEIYRKRIDLFRKYDAYNGKLLDQIKYDIEDEYAKGKISDQHYNLLNKKIESFRISDNKTSGNKIGDTNQTHVNKRSPI